MSQSAPIPNCVNFARNLTAHNRTSPFGMTLPEGSREFQRIISDAAPTDQTSILIASANAEWIESRSALAKVLIAQGPDADRRDRRSSWHERSPFGANSYNGCIQAVEASAMTVNRGTKPKWVYGKV